MSWQGKQIPQPGEEHLVHFTTENVQIHPKTGKRLSAPKLHKWYPAIFAREKAKLLVLGCDEINIIYEPKS